MCTFLIIKYIYVSFLNLILNYKLLEARVCVCFILDSHIICDLVLYNK